MKKRDCLVQRNIDCMIAMEISATTLNRIRDFDSLEKWNFTNVQLIELDECNF